MSETTFTFIQVIERGSNLCERVAIRLCPFNKRVVVAGCWITLATSDLIYGFHYSSWKVLFWEPFCNTMPSQFNNATGRQTEHVVVETELLQGSKIMRLIAI